MKKTLYFLGCCLALAWSMGTNPGRLVETTIDDLFYVRYHGMIVASEQGQLALYDREEQKKLINSCRRPDLPINTLFLEVKTLNDWSSQKNFNHQIHNQKIKIIAFTAEQSISEQIISFNINNVENSFDGIAFTNKVFETNPVSILEKTKLLIARNHLETSLWIEIPEILSATTNEQIMTLSNYTNFFIIPSTTNINTEELFKYVTDANSLAYLEVTPTDNKKYYSELAKSLAKNKSFQGFILNNANQ